LYFGYIWDFLLHFLQEMCNKDILFCEFLPARRKVGLHFWLVFIVGLLREDLQVTNSFIEIVESFHHLHPARGLAGFCPIPEAV